MAGLVLERDRPCLAGVGAATDSIKTSNCDAERLHRLRVDCRSDFGSAATGAEIAVIGAAEVSCALDLRPKPRAFANVERCSE